MGEKGTAKKAWSKIAFGILFVISCFIAMYILIHFHENMVFVGGAAALLLISAFLFLNAIFSDKAKNLALPEEEDLPSGNNGDFQVKVVKHMKEMEGTQKAMLEVLKNQNTLLQSQIENLEHEIYILSEKQVNQAKSIIKYNKENARQLAISERETLEYVMQEIKKTIEDNSSGVAVERVAEDEEYIAPEIAIPEVFEEPVEMPVVEETPVEETPTEDEFEIPELPDDLDLASLFDIPELNEEAPAPVEEEPKAEEAPAADPLAGLSSDPNAMMTPEDIAKLLEAMGQ